MIFSCSPKKIKSLKWKASLQVDFALMLEQGKKYKKIFLSLIKQQAPIVVWNGEGKYWENDDKARFRWNNQRNIFPSHIYKTNFILPWFPFSFEKSLQLANCIDIMAPLKINTFSLSALAFAVGILIMALTLFNNSRSDDVQYIVDM